MNTKKLCVVDRKMKRSKQRDFFIFLYSFVGGVSFCELVLIATGKTGVQYREKIKNMQNVSMAEYIKTNNIVCGRCGGTNTIGFRKR